MEEEDNKEADSVKEQRNLVINNIKFFEEGANF